MSMHVDVQVTFVDEQGIDEGGISREFFQLIIKQLMDSRYGLFTCDPDTHAFWIRPSRVHQMLDEFELIGAALQQVWPGQPAGHMHLNCQL